MKKRLFHLTFSFSRIVGLLPYTTTRKGLCYSRRWAIYSICFISVYFILWFSCMIEYVLSGRDGFIRNPYTCMLYVVQNSVQITIIQLQLFNITVKREDLSVLLRDLVEIHVANPSSCIVIPRLFTAVASIWIVVAYLSWPILKPQWFLVFVFSMHNDIVACLVSMQFCAAVRVHKSGYDVLTMSLQKKNVNVIKMANDHFRLLRKTHCLIAFYTKQILVVFALAMVKIISWSFYSFNNLYGNLSRSVGLIQMHMVLYQLSLLSNICRSCDLTTNAVSKLSKRFSQSSRIP